MKKFAFGTMIALLIALGVTAASVHADTELRLGTIGGLISADTAKAGDTIKIGIDWVNRNAVNYNPSMAFRIFSRSSFDGGDYGSGTATWISVAQVNTPPYYTLSTLRPRVGPQVDTSGGLPKPQFGAVYIFNCFGCEGSGVDTIAFAGAANDPDNQTAIPAMDSGLAVTLVVVTQLADTGKVICIDSSSNFPPTNTWKWAGYIPPGQPNEFPVWAGIKCWVLKNPAPSGVNDVTDGELPTKFDLRQNYPNPFNPSTKIEFDVPRKSHVTLTVYNVLGQAVNTLVNEEMTPGNKVVIWDGDSQTGVKVSSGMYFYKLSADGFLSTKKMLLVK